MNRMDIPPRAHRETGRAYALRVLTENIVQLQLEPGSMVSENELATQLGLSRTPVREALMELAHVGIVEVYPQRGSAVSLIDSDMVEEARFLRSVLECAVVAQLCHSASDALLEQLEANVRLQEFYLANRAPERLMELDNAFHKLLFTGANKLQTYAMMTGFTVHFDRVRNLSLHTVKELKIVEDHRAIWQALCAHDEEAATRCMEKHIARYKIDEVGVRAAYPQYFK